MYRKDSIIDINRLEFTVCTPHPIATCKHQRQQWIWLSPNLIKTYSTIYVLLLYNLCVLTRFPFLDVTFRYRSDFHNIIIYLHIAYDLHIIPCQKKNKKIHRFFFINTYFESLNKLLWSIFIIIIFLFIWKFILHFYLFDISVYSETNNGWHRIWTTRGLCFAERFYVNLLYFNKLSKKKTIFSRFFFLLVKEIRKRFFSPKIFHPNTLMCFGMYKKKMNKIWLFYIWLR